MSSFNRGIWLPVSFVKSVAGAEYVEGIDTGKDVVLKTTVVSNTPPTVAVSMVVIPDHQLIHRKRDNETESCVIAPRA